VVFGADNSASPGAIRRKPCGECGGREGAQYARPGAAVQAAVFPGVRQAPTCCECWRSGSHEWWVKNCDPARVAAEQASKHRARNAGQTGGVAFKLFNCPDIVRCQDTRVQWDPAFRAPPLFRGTGETHYDAPASQRTGAMTLVPLSTLILRSSRRLRLEGSRPAHPSRRIASQCSSR
jgi:hypothetical protein